MAKIPENIDLDLINKTLTKNQEKVLKILEANENKALREIAKDYKKAFDRIDKDLEKLYKKIGKGKVTFVDVQKFNRLNNLLDRAKKSLDDFYKNLDKDLNKTLIAASKNSLLGFTWSLDSAVNLSLSWDLSNKVAVQIAKDTPFYQLAKNKLYNDGLDGIRRTLNQGFKQGKSYIKLSKELQRQFGINYRQAERIVRTETHRIYEAAHNEEFLQSQAMGIDTYMLLTAVIDSVTRDQSFQVNNEKSNKEGKFKYPDGNYYIPGDTGNPAWDINDRERAIQVVDGVEPKGRYIKDRKAVVPESEVRKIIEERLK